MQSELTQEKLKEYLEYSPETGVFIWRKQGPAGIAGNLRNDGYIRIKLNGKQFMGHKLAWLYMTGSWPTSMIDHINRVRSDNRFSNLREASRVQNMQNAKKYKGTKSRYKGVYWFKNTSGRCWSAQCRVNKVLHYLGSFHTEEEAAAAYNKFASANFGEYFNGNTVERIAGVN